MSEEFNPQDWLNKPTSNPSIPQSFDPSVDISSEVDKVITRIEADLTDITSTYADWLNVGFAFASEFGEGGRNFYHRVSRFYNGYTKTDTDKQFDQCLKAHGHGITIKTFFHLAKQAGIEVGSGQCSVSSNQCSERHPVLNRFQDVSGPHQSFDPSILQSLRRS